MTDHPDPTSNAPRPVDSRAGVSRRRFLGYAGAGALATGATAAGGFAAGRAAADESAAGPGSTRYPFYGRHQAGIVTPVQDRLHFAAFDVSTGVRDELVALLTEWTGMAARLTQGEPAGEYGALGGPYQSPPDDTGEALGLPASGLTITFGFGPTLFRTVDGRDRFGLASARPEALIDLPHFPGDKLDPARSGGDLCVQACADDPQVAVHAVRNLARAAFGRASLRWSQLGFGRTASTTTTQSTPRNLFGFKDGTANLKAEEPGDLDDHVWVGAGDDGNAPWMRDGSYLVARRISMHIETWDRTSLQEQEQLIGRTKGTGAPLSGGTEHTAPGFTIEGGGGEPLIPATSHIRLAPPTHNGGVKMLRRGFNFTDGSDGLGRLDAGLFFLAYVRDPSTQFVPVQNRLARLDRLSIEYLQHTGSAIFAIPPGVSAGDLHVGEELFA